MKVSKAALEAFIKTILPTVEVVEDDTDSDFNSDEALRIIDEGREPIIKERVKDKMHQELRGRYSGSLIRQLIRQAGVTEADLKDAGGDEEAIKKALSLYSARITNGASDSQKVIEELTSRHSAELDAVKAELNGVITDLRGKYNRKEMLGVIVNELEGANIRSGVDKQRLAKLVLDEVSSLTDLSYEEEGAKINFYKKGTTAPALNKSGNALFSLKEAIPDIIKPFGVVADTTAHINPKTAMEGFSGSMAGAEPVTLGSLDAINKAVAAAMG